MFSPYIMWLHLSLSFLKFQGQKHVKILILRDLNAEGAWCAVGWGKGKLASMCMNPRAEGGAGAEDRLMSSHPSVGLRWAEGGLVTCRSRRGAGCYHRPSVFLKINIMSQSMGLSSLNHTANSHLLSTGVGWVGIGREAEKVRHICVSMTDLCWCMAETKTILWSNYPPIKNK